MKLGLGCSTIDTRELRANTKQHWLFCGHLEALVPKDREQRVWETSLAALQDPANHKLPSKSYYAGVPAVLAQNTAWAQYSQPQLTHVEQQQQQQQQLEEEQNPEQEEDYS